LTLGAMQLEQITSLTRESLEDEIAAAIDLVKQFPGYNRQLIQYLPLQHPVYLGRSANEVIRIRGYMFESFGHCGLPEEALPYVLEVLESERNAYLVAGAAIALRGLSDVEPEVASYLLKAIRNIKLADDAISFESYKPRWPLSNYTTGLLEICKTLQWMGAGAIEVVSDLKELCEDAYVSDRIKAEIKKALGVIEKGTDEGHQACCCGPATAPVDPGACPTPKPLTSDIEELILEDYSGARCTYKEYFKGKPTIVVFFYTRCDNPNKCSLTITKLGQLQKALAPEGLETRTKIAAITYDPIYDYPFRIKSYCENRGVVLNDEHRAFRIESGMPNLLRYFNSGVNYIGSIVNHHTTELYIIDSHGNICGHFRQLRWQIVDVIARLKECLSEDSCGEGNKRQLLSTDKTEKGKVSCYACS
jgi:protein SCO1/2